jgi:hypothetical protein
MQGLSVNAVPVEEVPQAKHILPTVITADSVKRRSNKHPQPSRILKTTGEDATVNFRELDGDEGGAEGERKRVRHEQPCKQVGSVVFIPANKWGEFVRTSKKWPYTKLEQEKTYIRVYNCSCMLYFNI